MVYAPFSGCSLDTPLDSPFSATLSVHGLHFTVCAPSNYKNPAMRLRQAWQPDLFCNPADQLQMFGTCDHDKGRKSAISGRRLHWRLSTGFLAFSPVFMCNLVKTSPLKSGESSEKIQWRKSRQILSRLWLSWFFRPRRWEMVRGFEKGLAGGGWRPTAPKIQQSLSLRIVLKGVQRFSNMPSVK